MEKVVKLNLLKYCGKSYEAGCVFTKLHKNDFFIHNFFTKSQLTYILNKNDQENFL